MAAAVAVDKLSSGHWEEVWAYDKARKLDYIKAFKDFLVVVGREGGFVQIWVRHHTM